METYVLEEIGLVGHTINNDTVIDTMLDNIIGANPTSYKKVEEFKYAINKNEYTIESEIGSGSYGKVFQIMKDGTKYALKEQEYGGDRDELKNMIKESILQFILYKNSATSFPQIFQIAWSRKYFFIIMELLDPNEGTILNNLDEYRGKESHKKDQYMLHSCNITKKIATILESLKASLEFSHGDLNQGNIYLKNDKSVKLLDFGFSNIKLGKNRITTNDLSKNYRPGKDLTILARNLLYNVDENYEYAEKDAKDIFNFLTSIIVEPYNEFFYKTRELYESLDTTLNNDVGNPDNVLANLNMDCEIKLENTPLGSPITGTPATGSPANSPRGSAGGARTKRRKNPSRRLARKTQKLSSRLRPSSLMDEGIKITKSSVELIHDKKSRYNPESLEKILKTSTIPHIQSNASKIATQYLKEKEKSLTLDLFKILLYYDGEHFDTFCKEYSELKTLSQKQKYLYGTDLSNTTYIHWNTKDTGIKV
jgi:tRNA A-37 threonylcarbamoyl transferase component Bud32